MRDPEWDASTITIRQDARMKSPWKSFGSLEQGVSYLVLASRIPAKSLRSTPAMFRGAGLVRKQLAGTDGVIGFSLLAEPVRKRYATLSVWRDQAALDAFTTANPHGRLMADLAPQMGETKFVTWTITGNDGLPTWDDALRRLAP